jgi:hypothetical protein
MSIAGSIRHPTEARGQWRSSMPPIGDEGLTGEVRRGMVTISGPCGGEHTMSLRAARQLLAWLDRQPEITGKPVIDG